MLSMLKKKTKTYFTLIELIVVIVILGILAAIVVPNVASFQKEATVSAIASDSRNLQTSVDMFALKNEGGLPTTEQPTVEIPQSIDFTQIMPKHLRQLPKTKGVYYWVDYEGAVWSSTVDAPTNIQKNGTELSWKQSPDAVSYQVFEVIDSSKATGSLNNAYVHITLKTLPGKIMAKDFGETAKATGLKDSGKYLVNAIDKNGFETAPVGLNEAGQTYTGSTPLFPTAPVETTPAPTEPSTEPTTPTAPVEPVITDPLKLSLSKIVDYKGQFVSTENILNLSNDNITKNKGFYQTTGKFSAGTTNFDVASYIKSEDNSSGTPVITESNIQYVQLNNTLYYKDLNGTSTLTAGTSAYNDSKNFTFTALKNKEYFNRFDSMTYSNKGTVAVNGVNTTKYLISINNDELLNILNYHYKGMMFNSGKNWNPNGVDLSASPNIMTATMEYYVDGNGNIVREIMKMTTDTDSATNSYLIINHTVDYSNHGGTFTIAQP